MTKPATINLTASDTIHITSVRSEPLLAGDTFDFPTADAEDLVARGLATKTASAKPAAKSK